MNWLPVTLSPVRLAPVLLTPLIVLAVGFGLAAAQAAEPAPIPPPPSAAPAPVTVEVVVDGGAYAPSSVTVPAGRPVRVVFTKKDWSGCTREVVFPSLGLKAVLETGKPVAVELPAQAKGTVPFQCGMAMVKGQLVVE